jgi:chaperone required for assembly of F1-ATPase
MTSDDNAAQAQSARVKEIAAARPRNPKRVYADVAVMAVEDGYAITLDGRTAKTPKRFGLVVPSAALADAVAGEWQAQGDEIIAESMPLTRLANTAIDGVTATMEKVLDTLEDYARSDLLCYQVAYPESLSRHQSEKWQPILDWVAATHGAQMVTTTGLVAVEQPDASIGAIRQAFARYCPWRLTAAHTLAGVYKSVVLSLAVMDRHIDARAAFDLATIDEEFQAGIWGEDAEAKQRSDKLAGEAIAAEVFALLTTR